MLYFPHRNDARPNFVATAVGINSANALLRSRFVGSTNSLRQPGDPSLSHGAPSLDAKTVDAVSGTTTIADGHGHATFNRMSRDQFALPATSKNAANSRRATARRFGPMWCVTPLLALMSVPTQPLVKSYWLDRLVNRRWWPFLLIMLQLGNLVMNAGPPIPDPAKAAVFCLAIIATVAQTSQYSH